MFERFTDRARRVVVLAQEESRLQGHACIGTEHVLLGLIREPECVGAQILVKLGVDLADLRAQIIATVTGGVVLPKGARLVGVEPRNPATVRFTVRGTTLAEIHDKAGAELSRFTETIGVRYTARIVGHHVDTNGPSEASLLITHYDAEIEAHT